MGFRFGVAFRGDGQIIVGRIFLSGWWVLQLLRPEAHKGLTIEPTGADFTAQRDFLLHNLLSFRVTATSGGEYCHHFYCTDQRTDFREATCPHSQSQSMPKPGFRPRTGPALETYASPILPSWFPNRTTSLTICTQDSREYSIYYGTVWI